MAKLQIPITDELMQDAKIYALHNSTTLKAVVTLALAQYISSTSNTTTTEKSNKSQNSLPSPKKDDRIEEKKEEKETYDPEKHILIRKTHKKKEMKANPIYNHYGVEWTIQWGCYAHYDKDGELIPFRLSDWDGNDVEPSEDEIRQVEENTGKKVVFE